MPLRAGLLLALALAVAAAACGGDAGGPSAEGTDTTVAQDASAFPVTIEHMLGTVTIEEPPRRVLALGMADQDIALALGITPLAMVENPYSDDGLFPWAEEGRDLSGVELVPIDLRHASTEQLVALRPDLILATSAEGDESLYEQYSGLGVPIIAPISGPVADSWQDRTRVIGRALGREQAAEDLVATTEATIDAVAADLPELEGRSFTVALAGEPAQVRAVNRGTDTLAQLFGELGMHVALGLAALGNDTPVGAVDVSVERLDLLEADVVLMTGPYLDDVESTGMFQGLQAVEQGTYHRYDGATAYGLRVPTPLSIPYVLDQVRPTLERDAGLPPIG